MWWRWGEGVFRVAALNPEAKIRLIEILALSATVCITAIVLYMVFWYRPG